MGPGWAKLLTVELGLLLLMVFFLLCGERTLICEIGSWIRWLMLAGGCKPPFIPSVLVLLDSVNELKASGLFLPHSGKSKLLWDQEQFVSRDSLTFVQKQLKYIWPEIEFIYFSFQQSEWDLDCCWFDSLSPPFQRQENTVTNTNPCVFQKVAKILLLAKPSARYSSSNIPFKQIMLLCFGMLPCMAGFCLKLPHTAIHSKTPTCLIMLFGFRMA